MFKYLDWIVMLHKLQNMKKEGGYLIIVYVVQDKHTFSRGAGWDQGGIPLYMVTSSNAFSWVYTFAEASFIIVNMQ